MAYIPKLYLETTVFNFYFVEKEGKKQQDTHMLFDAIKLGKFQVFTSQDVLDEISKDTLSRYHCKAKNHDRNRFCKPLSWLPPNWFV